jgi:selenide,water dikinase
VLLILSCGSRYAIATRGGWSVEGRWVWWWKNAIDRRWLKRLTVP